MTNNNDSQKVFSKKGSKVSATNSENDIKDYETAAAEVDRRDFITYAAGAFGVVGMCSALLPFVKSMNPGADARAASTIDVDLKGITEGSSRTVMFLGKPIFIRARTAAEIKELRSVDLSSLPDPQKDQERTLKDKWLVVVGVCTHLGCVPNGQRPSENKGEYGGWFCPCHGSHYDASGRIRKGPAPRNLELPKYTFLDENTIRIG